MGIQELLQSRLELLEARCCLAQRVVLPQAGDLAGLPAFRAACRTGVAVVVAMAPVV